MTPNLRTLLDALRQCQRDNALDAWLDSLPEKDLTEAQIDAAMARVYAYVDTPLGSWDWHAPTPCRFCGLPALDHEVLGERLVCPGAARGKGETFAPAGGEQV